MPSNRYQRFLAGAAVSLVLIVLMSLTARGAGPWSGWFGAVLSPFTWAGESVASGFYRGTGAVGNVVTLEQDNQALRRQVEALTKEVGLLNQAAAENAQLRAALGLAQRQGFGPSTAAEVIARTPSRWFSSVLINKGTVQGLRTGLPVVDAQGLVGEVQRADANTSTVLLITDPQSGAGALDRKTGEEGVLVGGLSGSDLVKLQFFSRRAKIKVGDEIVTSGLGKVYPANIKVGWVETVGYQNYGLVKYALVRPAAGLDALFAVLIYTGGK